MSSPGGIFFSVPGLFPIETLEGGFSDIRGKLIYLTTVWDGSGASLNLVGVI